MNTARAIAAAILLAPLAGLTSTDEKTGTSPAQQTGQCTQSNIAPEKRPAVFVSLLDSLLKKGYVIQAVTHTGTVLLSPKGGCPPPKPTQMVQDKKAAQQALKAYDYAKCGDGPIVIGNSCLPRQPSPTP